MVNISLKRGSDQLKRNDSSKTSSSLVKQSAPNLFSVGANLQPYQDKESTIEVTNDNNQSELNTLTENPIAAALWPNQDMQSRG